MAEKELTEEEKFQIEREVQRGKTDVLPSGETINEVRAKMREAEKETDAASEAYWAQRAEEKKLTEVPVTSAEAATEEDLELKLLPVENPFPLGHYPSDTELAEGDDETESAKNI